MTHLEGVIRDVKKFVATTPTNKKIKKRVLIKLYGVESMEKKQVRHTRHNRRRKQGALDIVVSSIAEGKKQYTSYKASQSQKRIQKAETVKKLLSSNLPESKKQEQISEVRKHRGLRGLFSGKKGKPNYTPVQLVSKTEQPIQKHASPNDRIIHKKYDDEGNVEEINVIDDE